MSKKRKEQKEEERIAMHMLQCAIWNHESNCWEMPHKLSDEEQRIYDELLREHGDDRDCNWAAYSARHNHKSGTVGSFYCNKKRCYVFGVQELEKSVHARRLVLGCARLFDKLGVRVLGFQDVDVAWAMVLGTWSYELCDTVVKYAYAWASGIPDHLNRFGDDLSMWHAEHLAKFDVLEHIMPDRDE
jgi:hypothetical protein